MQNISVLDCTLRDGGYCNDWKFGEHNIHKIVKGLIDANVEFVECGFLTNRVEYDKDASRFTTLDQIKKFIPSISTKQLFAVMLNVGEYEIEKISDNRGDSVDIIRIAFHKKNMAQAFEDCRCLQEKGYMVFLQPMVSMNYSDTEFLHMIDTVNNISPYACYIVDSFGMMKKRDVIHYFHLMNANLDKNISIGFHAHNNFQSALSNAQALIEQETVHNLIIDSSIYGMGRGAGNLNSELFLNELNSGKETPYAIKPLLQIMDEVISHFYDEQPWGYSLPNYLSASHMIHPNYARYLNDKNTLTYDAINDIFSMMCAEKAVEFDADYIEKMYVKYMSQGNANNTHMEEFVKQISGKTILLIAPGRTCIQQKEDIRTFIEKHNAKVIGINHKPEICDTDYIFVSNMRRFKSLPENVYDKTITTTNIKASSSYLNLDYYSLTNPSGTVHDNAGMMAIQFMINIGCREIWLAGFDGYQYQTSKNYEDHDMMLVMREDQIDDLNFGIQQTLEEFSQKINIRFLTQTRFKLRQ